MSVALLNRKILHFVNFTSCEESLFANVSISIILGCKICAQISHFILFNVRRTVAFFSDVNNWYQIFTNVKNRYQIPTRVKNR